MEDGCKEKQVIWNGKSERCIKMFLNFLGNLQKMQRQGKEKIYRNQAVIVMLALTCCALWGSAFPCVKIGYELFNIEGTGSQILFAGCRFFLAGIMALALTGIMQHGFVKIKISSVPYIIGQGMLQTTLQYIFFYIGMANTTGSKGSVINASNAFFSIITAHFFLKGEKINIRKITGCFIGFIGVILVNIKPGGFGMGFSFQGEGMILLCSAAYGISSVTLKKVSERESPAAITAYQLLSGGAVLVITGLLLGGRIGAFSLKPAVLLIYMALLSTVAFNIWAGLLKYNPVGKIAVYSFSIPVFGVAFSAILLNESILSVQNLAALILVSAGIVIVNFNKEKIVVTSH